MASQNEKLNQEIMVAHEGGEVDSAFAETTLRTYNLYNKQGLMTFQAAIRRAKSVDKQITQANVLKHFGKLAADLQIDEPEALTSIPDPVVDFSAPAPTSAKTTGGKKTTKEPKEKKEKAPKAEKPQKERITEGLPEGFEATPMKVRGEEVPASIVHKALKIMTSGKPFKSREVANVLNQDLTGFKEDTGYHVACRLASVLGEKFNKKGVQYCYGEFPAEEPTTSGDGAAAVATPAQA